MATESYDTRNLGPPGRGGRRKREPLRDWQKDPTIYRDDDGKVQEDWATCGTCGRQWNDALGTGLTPVPSGRCPFEYEHKEEKERSPEKRIGEFVMTVGKFTLAQYAAMALHRDGVSQDQFHALVMAKAGGLHPNDPFATNVEIAIRDIERGVLDPKKTKVKVVVG